MYIVTFHTATWYCIETRPPFFYLRPHTHFRCIYHGDIILSMSICCPKIILKSLYLRITKSFLSQFKIDTLVESFVRKAWKHGSEIKSFFKITFCPFLMWVLQMCSPYIYNFLTLTHHHLEVSPSERIHWGRQLVVSCPWVTAPDNPRWTAYCYCHPSSAFARGWVRTLRTQFWLILTTLGVKKLSVMTLGDVSLLFYAQLSGITPHL